MPDGDPLLWQLLFQLLLILINAFFACAEIAIISTNDNKLNLLAAGGDKRAARLVELTEKPARFLSTIQVGITLAGFLGSAFAAGNFATRLTAYLTEQGSQLPIDLIHTGSTVVVTIVLSYFTLVLGELVPKRLAMQKAEKLALAMSATIWFVSKAFSPVVWLLTKSTNGVLRLLGVDPTAEDGEVTEEEIRMLVDEGSEKGAIDKEEKEIIHNVFEFDNKTADEVMTHRVEAKLLWLEEDDTVWKETMRDTRHSHYPVCDQTADNIVGVLNSKDYYGLLSQDRDTVMQWAVHKAQFVPESVRTDILFRNMKQNRNHFAVVLDEYGGMSGIVTMNDLLEQLVGDLEDDASQPPEEPLLRKISDGQWEIDCSASPETVATELGVKLPEEVFDDHDTFAGIILSVLGTIPEDGDTPELTAYGLDIVVTSIVEHRIEKAIVTPCRGGNN
ncbi:MAG: hemolysin family protein [Oscillospiraceae bacterium]|jgi:putative hemolysin|nr:hemolysin family protein [Oscillospiraceae bacterium]